MKKVWKMLSLLLIVAMLAGFTAVALTGCGQETAEEETEFQLEVEGFQVGFSRAIMNPETSAPLTGYGNDKFRYFKNVLDNMTCSAIAISDGTGNHYIWMTSDLMSTTSLITSTVAKAVSQKTGIPEENFMISVTHSHAAPTASSPSLQGSAEFRDIVIQKHIEAAVEALMDRKPAEMYVGSVETERLNFVRHLYNIDMNGERKYFGDNFGTHVYDDTTQFAHMADPTLHMVRFVREGEKGIIVANFRGHSHFADGLNAYDLSADCWASFREALEYYTGDHVAFFQGAAGNTNTRSNMPMAVRTRDMRTYGNYMAQHALEGLENNMEKVNDPKISYRKETFEAQINHSMDHMYAKAKEISTIWSQTGNKADIAHLLTQDGTGIRSPYHASAIVANFSRTVSSDGQLTIRVFSLGEQFAVCSFPGELFEALSTQMEEESPFDYTMLFGYTDHYVGYMPTAACFEYTSYETDICHFEAGSGELVLQAYMDLLNELYDQL